MKIRDDIIKKFYREIYQPAKSMETFISRIKPSLTEISEEMSLAKIISILNAEKTMIRDEVVDGELLLLDTGKKTGDVFSTHFVNGDGSRLEMQFWKEEGLTFTEEELKAVQGEFTPSQFVKKITGVENVCERSAVLGYGGREGLYSGNCESYLYDAQLYYHQPVA